MKQCPRCHQTYSDDSLNFCLEDGELLTAFAREPAPTRYAEDPPPTMVMNEARVTNPTNWPASAQPPARWQPQGLNLNQPFGSQAVQSTDQTLPTISLVLGIMSILMACCYGGIWLGVPAAIIGFLGMRNADNDPSRYGGRGMAIGGMVLGVVSLMATLVVAFFAIIAS